MRPNNWEANQGRTVARHGEAAFVQGASQNLRGLLPSSMSGGAACRAQELRECLSEFPKVRHAFAYGSGVFHQPGLYTKGSGNFPMIDFIFVVDNPSDWHSENIKQNRRHYSFLASFGGSAVAACADTIGVGVSFNTLVPWRHQTIKYGVVGADALLKDLKGWEALYLSGRMHKPVLSLQEDAEVSLAAKANLSSAVDAALLMLPEKFSTQELMETICSLSYSGDVRMGIAEDGCKIQKIVNGNKDGFTAMYDSAIETAKCAGLQEVGPSVWSQRQDLDQKTKLLSRLPRGVLSQLADPNSTWQAPRPLGEHEQSQVVEAVARAGQTPVLLASALAAIVRRSSARQAVSGLLAVGPAKSITYVGQKLSKAWSFNNG